MKFLFVLLFLFSKSSFSESIYLFPLNVQSSQAQNFEAVNFLIQDTVIKEGNSITSQKDGADFSLKPSLLSLGNSFIFTMQRLNKNGEIVDSEKLKSQTLSDLDSVISRVTRAALSSSKAENNSRVGEVTEVDSKKNYERIKARKSFYLGLGPGWASELNGNDGISFLGGLSWGLSQEFDLLLEYSYFNAKESSAAMNSIMFGGKYFFMNEKHAPYGIINLGYMAGRFGDENSNIISDTWINGWAAGLGVGMNFFRTSSTNFSLQLKAKHLFDTAKVGSSETEQPTITTFELLINL